MMYKVHTRQAQLSLFKDDELPKTLIKPDSIKTEPHHRAFRRMVRKVWDIKTKT